MLYFLVRPFVRLGLRILYQRIDLAHIDRIPQDQPVILAANHPTAFIEPCILACYLNRPLHFLARGDLFTKPLYIRILRSLHILPVYRLRDGGYSKLRKNYETFEACHQALAQRKTIMVLAEGRCIHEKKLRPLRKGTARIALGTLTEKPAVQEVYVVPVGINFTYADRARSTVMITFNEPIRASDYLATYQEHPHQAINDLTEALREKLAEDVIDLPTRTDEQTAEYLFRLYRTERVPLQRSPIGSDATQLRAEKAIADRVKTAAVAEKEGWLAKLHDYFSRLELMQIDDRALRGQYQKIQRQFSHFVWLLLGLPVLLWHAFPLFLGEYIASTKVKEIEFYLPVKATVMAVAYLVYCLLWVVWAVVSGSYGLVLVPPVAIVLGVLWLYQFERAERWLLGWRARHQTPDDLRYVRELREALVRILSN